MDHTSDVVLMYCAAGSRENAEQIAAALVERRVAACVQIAPIESVYRWDGAVQREPEFLLHIKTTAARAGDAERCITELHAYELPEISVVPITGGSSRYLEWVRRSVAPHQP